MEEARIIGSVAGGITGLRSLSPKADSKLREQQGSSTNFYRWLEVIGRVKLREQQHFIAGLRILSLEYDSKLRKRHDYLLMIVRCSGSYTHLTPRQETAMSGK
jgi:hypothetical protein